MPALLSLATFLLASLEASWVVPVRELSVFEGAGETIGEWLTLNLVRDVVAGLLDGIHDD
jgi:hypothetical protein